ncbi:MAG: hypothetical protein ACE5JQ_13650 [Candidatus Methylomirabilales bacterium]
MNTKQKIRKTLVTATPETSRRTLAILMRDRHVGPVTLFPLSEEKHLTRE